MLMKKLNNDVLPHLIWVFLRELFHVIMISCLRNPDHDQHVSELIMELLADEYTSVYGYRKLTKMLQREHRLVINKKKVYRLYKVMNVLRPQRKLKIKHPRSGWPIIGFSRALIISGKRILSMGGQRRRAFLLPAQHHRCVRPDDRRLSSWSVLRGQRLGSNHAGSADEAPAL